MIGSLRVKEILALVYYGSIVYINPKSEMSSKQCRSNQMLHSVAYDGLLRPVSPITKGTSIENVAQIGLDKMGIR